MTIEPTSNPLAPTPSPGSHADLAATQVTLGAGLVDITRIDHDGRTGVLFRPREKQIPFGEPGELPEGKYWPVPGDVILWVTGDGPGVAIEHLAALAASPTAPAGEPVAWVATIKDALLQARGALHLDAMTDKAGKPYGTTMVAQEAIGNALALFEAPTAPAQGGDGWLPIETAPRDRPVVARTPCPHLPGGWLVATVSLPDPDDDESRLSGCSAIMGWDGRPMLTRFRQRWTHWRDDAPPASPSKTQEG